MWEVINHVSWIRLCQKQLCKRLNPETFSSKIELNKRELYGNLNGKKLCDNKKFWGVVKLALSNKAGSNEKIILVAQDKIVENDKKNWNCFQRFFLEHDLGIP